MPRLDQRQLAGAAAQVKVEQHLLWPLGRQCDRARAVGGQDRLEIVTGRYTHEAASLGTEKLGQRAGIAAFEGSARQDHGARVDVIRLQRRIPVGAAHESAERLGIDQPVVAEGRQQDGRPVDRLAPDHHEPAGK